METQTGKTVPIEYNQVFSAYKKVRAGGQSTGIDKESWEDFDKKLEQNLYIIWNRLSSGSYHPQAVREVAIPKSDGTKRKLGIPTVRDRIAQQVVKEYMEQIVDKLFHENSYGYRPLKSAHQALEQVRTNSFENDWVIDMDISKFFDEIDHELMMKAVKHVMQETWVAMYIQRWLEMPIAKEDGTIEERKGKGTPQGGVISPLLANLYLHYTLDVWLGKNYPEVSFVRYADDVVIHCKSEEQAKEVLQAIRSRLHEVKLEIKEEKTRIAYCKDYKRFGTYENVKFEFLGYSFQPRGRKSNFGGQMFMGFTAEISVKNQQKIRDTIKESVRWHNTEMEIQDIAKYLNSKLRGWINYYGLFSKICLSRTLQTVDIKLIKWIQNKYKIKYRKAKIKLRQMKEQHPKMFCHWEKGYC